MRRWQRAREVPLRGGYLNENRVFRSGSTVVRRQDHRWPLAVEEALRVVARRGYTASPLVVGRQDEQSVVLSYMTGHALPDPVPVWATSARTLRRVTRFLAEFSAAAEDAIAEIDSADWLVPPRSEGLTFVHGDPHPTNIVFNVWRRPSAIIDFELATAGTHDWNLVSLIFTWAPLEPRELTCWRDAHALDAAHRVRSIVGDWPFVTSPATVRSVAADFVAWRLSWIEELARLGNPGAAGFLRSPRFAERYEHALDLLDRALSWQEDGSALVGHDTPPPGDDGDLAVRPLESRQTA